MFEFHSQVRKADKNVSTYLLVIRRWLFKNFNAALEVMQHGITDMVIPILIYMHV